MGTYLNPGKSSYEEAIRSEIFIDKSDMIPFLNSVVGTKQKYVSVSRPRRFGKTIAADMICAYYDVCADSRKMFEDLKIAKEHLWDQYLGKFDVIRIVMTRFFKDDIPVEDALTNLQQLITRDIIKKYPDIDYYDTNSLAQTIEDAYQVSKYKLVIVVDEWDAVFRVRQGDSEGHTKYLDFLRDLLKDNDHIALAYMTGILPIKKNGEHSALNMFTEYSMVSPRQLAPYTGFTETEVKDLCAEYSMDYQEIAGWYNGYTVSGHIPTDLRDAYRDGTYEGHKISIYSPLSVVEAMTTGVIKDYWNRTETYEALAEYIRRDFDGLKDTVALLMDGGRVPVDISTYQNDMTTFTCRDDVLSLLIHLGYLGYDDESKEVFIPNKELMDEFKASTKSSEWSATFKSFELSQMLLEATWKMDSKRVAELVEKAHDLAGNKTYNDEAALSYGIQLAYYAAQKYYTTVLELDTGKGYADIVYLPSPKHPDKPVLLVELKYNKNAETAISQIKKQNYPQQLEHYKGNILLVGIDYDKDTRNDDPEYKHHNCMIEKA